MARRGKRGRKPNNRGTAEKLWMKALADQLETLLKDPKWDIDRVRKELSVSRASLFNYKNRSDLANPDVFKRAHERLGFTFPYMDFGQGSKTVPNAVDPKNAQSVFPFLEGLRNEDVQVIHKKNVGRETLELTVQIRFGGGSTT